MVDCDFNLTVAKVSDFLFYFFPLSGWETMVDLVEDRCGSVWRPRKAVLG